MTANEMFDMFLIEYDSRQIQDTMGFEEDEVSHFLTNAERMLIKQAQMGGLETQDKFRQLTAGLKRDSHQDAVSTAALTDTDELHPFGEFWSHPEDLWIILQEYAVPELGDNPLCDDSIPKGTIVLPVKPIAEDYYLANRLNKNRQPYFDGIHGLVWRLAYNYATPPAIPPVGFVNPRRVELITNADFGIAEYHIRYIKTPNPIVVDTTNPASAVDSEIFPEFHRDIVFKAVELALENSQNQRFQSLKILNQEQSL